MSGKGSKRRVGKSGLYESNYEGIDWQRGRTSPRAKDPSFSDALINAEDLLPRGLFGPPRKTP